MRITIDTAKDSGDDIKKAIDFLTSIMKKEPTEGAFNMFDEKSPEVEKKPSIEPY